MKHVARRPLALGLLALASCGVLTIDVDVYKGPLADHEDLQVQELAVLAIGAKPILIELRNRLEEEAQGVDGVFSSFVQDGYVERGRYDVDTVEGIILYRSQLAARVNAVLSLYEDQFPEGFGGKIARLRRLAYEYQDAYDVIRPPAEYRDERWERWTRYAESMSLNEPRAELLALKNAYRDFLVGTPSSKYDWREQNAIFDAFMKLCPNWTYVPRGISAKASKAELQFRQLRESDLVEQSAKLLYKDAPDDVSREFVIEVREVAASYLHASELSKEILTVSLEALILAQDPDVEMPPTTRRAVQGSLESVIRILDPKGAESTIESPKMFLDERQSGGVVDSLLFGGIEAVGLRDLPREDLEFVLVYLTGTASGLDRGRSARGIEGRIEDYLATEEGDGSKSPEDVEAVRDMLLHDLVRFSTKILFLADHESVLSGQLDDESRQYIRVLQAVGNSIRIQADELTRFYERRDGVEARNEVLALRGALMPTPEEFLVRVIQALEGDQRRLETTQKSLATEVAERDRLQAAVGPAEAKVAAEKAQLATRKEERAAVGNVLHALAGVKDPPADGNAPKPLPELAEFVQTVPGTGEEIATKVAEELGKKPDQKEAADLLKKNAATWGKSKGADSKEHLAAIVKNVTDAVAQAQASLQKAEEASAGAATALEQAQAKHAATVKTVAKLEARVQELAARAPAVDLVLKHMRDEGQLTVRKLYEQDPAPGDAKTREALLALVPDDSPEGRTARTILQGILAGSAPAYLADALPGESAVDVLDRHIAALRHELLASVEVSGEGGRTPYLLQVLEHARAQRADLAYLLRPSAVLRSSYTFADSQAGSAGAWDNMLQSHAVRSLPLIGEALSSCSSELEREVLEQIDKRSWQNVNRVRVAGAGNTNFVVAKDDVGNWYVKGYSADAKPITDAMIKLGTATLAPGLASSLLDEKGELIQGDAPSPLANLFVKHQKRYQDATLKDRDDLKAALGDEGLQKEIAQAWKPADKELEAKLVELLQGAAADAGVAGARTALEAAEEVDQPARIMDGLSALGRTAEAIKKRLAALKADDPDQILAAGRDATLLAHSNRILGKALGDFLRRRLDANQDLETAVVILGAE